MIGRGLALAPALQCPASVAIDLRTPRRFPLGRHRAALDGVLLGLGQSRPARLDHRRIDDLTAHRQPSLRPQYRVKPCEETLDRADPRQLLAIEPDRLGIGRRVVQRQADKPHKRQPIPELIFGLIVRQRVQRLQHQDFKHHHRVIGRTASPLSIRARQRRFKLDTKNLKIYHQHQPFQRIAGRR